MSHVLSLFWWLVVGHALADFALQSDTMAKGKNRHRPPQRATGSTYLPPWPYWLTSHALIHGGAVALILGAPILGVCETVAHWCIDFGKCEDWYGIHGDQSLHLVCKVLWISLLVTVHPLS